MPRLSEHIGNRLRARRVQLGLSQAAVGRRVGITFQQVQKYENGTNMMNAERLFQLAESLNVPIIYFFVGYKGAGVEGLSADSSDRETLELVKSFNRIADKSTRKAIADMVRAVGRTTNG